MTEKNFVVRHGLEVYGDANVSGSVDISGNTKIGGDLNVSGSAYISGGLTLRGNTSSNSNLDIGGNTSLGGTLTVSGATNITNTLTVSGHTDLNRDLNVSGNTSLHGTLVTKGAASFTSTLDVKGNTSLGGTLYVSGTASFGSSLDVSGNTSLGGTLTVSGHTDLNRDLNVSGNTSLQGTLVTKAAASFASTLDVKGNTSLGGTLTVSGHTDLNRDLNVSGNTSLHGTLVTKGAASFASTLDVKGNTSLGGTLNITNTLTVSGHTDLNRDLNVSGNTSLHGTLRTTGNASFASRLDVKGNTSLGGTLTVSGHTDLNRNLDVSGNASVGGDLTVTGNVSVNGGMIVSGSFQVGGAGGSGVNIDANTTLGGTLTVSGNTTLNSSVDVSGNIQAGGTLSASTLKGANHCGTNANFAYLSATTIRTTSFRTTGTLTVCGSGDISGNLQVGGVLSGTTLRTTSLRVTGIGTASICGSMDVSGSVQVAGEVCTGTLRSGGEVCFGTLAYVNQGAGIGINAGTVGLYDTILVGERRGAGGTGDGYASITLSPGAFGSKIDGTTSFISIWTNKNAVADSRFDILFGTSTEQLRLRPRGQDVLVASTTSSGVRSVAICGSLQVSGTLSASTLKGANHCGTNANFAYISGTTVRTTSLRCTGNAIICGSLTVSQSICSIQLRAGYASAGQLRATSANITTLRGSYISYTQLRATSANFTNQNITNLTVGGTLTAAYISATSLTTSGTITIQNVANQALFKTTGTNPTVIHRNDGSNYWILLSNSFAGPCGTWNTLRPFYINTGTGLLHSLNGQFFTGGARIGGGLTVSGAASLCGALTVGAKIDAPGQTISAGTIRGGTHVCGTNGQFAFVSGTTVRTTSLRVTGGGQVAICGNGGLRIGPNSTWGQFLHIGGNGNQANASAASVVTTNGNLHLDGADNDHAVYLNWYGGNTGTYFGAGDGNTTRGRMDGAGNFGAVASVSSPIIRGANHCGTNGNFAYVSATTLRTTSLRITGNGTAAICGGLDVSGSVQIRGTLSASTLKGANHCGTNANFAFVSGTTIRGTSCNFTNITGNSIVAPNVSPKSSFAASANRPVGWYTIAVNIGDRASGMFTINEAGSGRHGAYTFFASHMFGTDNSNGITLIHKSAFGTTPARYIRIKEGGTYDGALLQIYIDNATNNFNNITLTHNFSSSGWVLKNFIADGTNPGGVQNFAALTNVAAQIDLDSGGAQRNAIIVNGEIYAGGRTSQTRVWRGGDTLVGNVCGTDANFAYVSATTLRTTSLRITGDGTAAICGGLDVSGSVQVAGLLSATQLRAASTGFGTVSYRILQGPTTNTRDKIRVWSGGTYVIGMESAVTFGGLNDYAMTFQMNNDADRGWWWGHNAHTKAQGAMALRTDGRVNFAGGARIGFGVADTGTPGANGLAVNGTTYVSGALQVKSTISAPTVRGITHVCGGNGNFGYASATQLRSVSCRTTNLAVLGSAYLSGTTRVIDEAHAQGANDYHMELFSNNTGSDGEISIRFHHGNRYYYQIRTAGGYGGFRMTQGNDNNLVDLTVSDLRATYISAATVRGGTHVCGGNGNFGYASATQLRCVSLGVANNAYISGVIYHRKTHAVYDIPNQVLMKPAGTIPTVIHRNDGANYYILLSNAAAGVTGVCDGGWNGLRPFYINVTTGLLHSLNGQYFTGKLDAPGQTISAGTVRGGSHVCGGNGNFGYASATNLRSASFRVANGAYISGYIRMRGNNTIANGINGISIFGTTWAGFGITGPNATKTFGLHYGGSNDNKVRFGRYAKAADVNNTANYEENPFLFDLDNGLIQATTLQASVCAGSINVAYISGSQIRSTSFRTGNAYLSTAYANWFRARNATGFYFENRGTGIRSPLDETACGVVGTYGSVATYGGEAGWEGFSIGGAHVFMGRPDGSFDCGIYDDRNNRWIMYVGGNSNSTALYRQGTDRLHTTGAGIRVNSVVCASELRASFICTTNMRCNSFRVFNNAYISDCFHTFMDSTTIGCNTINSINVQNTGGYIQCINSGDTSTTTSPGRNKGLRMQMQTNIARHVFHIAPVFDINANGTSRHFDKDLRYDFSRTRWQTKVSFDVSGTLTARTKSFVIDHPTRENYKLQYACLEGPENGVYIRGKLVDSEVVPIPDFWSELVHEDSVTVNLTPVGTNPQIHSIIKSNNTSVRISSQGKVNCHYIVYGERKDIDRLIIEYESDDDEDEDYIDEE